MISILRLSHDIHQLLDVVRAAGVDGVAVLKAGLLAHLGGKVELDGRLGDVEVAAAEEAEDQLLVLGEGGDVARAQTEVEEKSFLFGENISMKCSCTLHYY